MLNVIFLDIDGVMVTRNSITKHQNTKDFDESCVEQLNRILATKENIGIVITSTWRIGLALDDMRAILEAQGIKGNIIGLTPRGRVITRDNTPSPTRGDEIYTWLVTSFSSDEILKIKAFVIDDEASDIGIMNDCLFETQFQDGLTKEVADDIIFSLVG